jgi:hypothetical protein
MNRQRRAESFAKEVAKHLESTNTILSTEELLNAGYYWGISEVIGEIEMLLVKAEFDDTTIKNTAICNAIRNYIKSVI